MGFQTLIDDLGIVETLIDSANLRAVTFTGRVELGLRWCKGNIPVKKCGPE